MKIQFSRSAFAVVGNALAALIEPPPAIAPATWAARNMRLPDGPYKGELFNPEITPYLVEPLNFFASDSPGNKGVLRKSKQIGASTLAIAACGYTADVEPCDVFLVEPTDSNLADFNSEKFQRAIDDSPVLRTKVLPQTARSGRGSTTYVKRFPGGSILMAIATSTSDLRGKTRKKVIKDEASEYPDDLDGQGSPHDMIAGAYESFLATAEWKELSISTPVIKGACYIDAQFEAGDQRYWHVPCPHCGAEFVFRFDRKLFLFADVYPYGAHYAAPCCGGIIEAHEKDALVRKGRWIATAPGPGKHFSWHFDALSSPFVPWDVIAQRYIEAKDDPAKLKTFDNLVLGLAHEIKGDAPDHVRLLALREDYDRRRIPPRGLLLVAAADVQANAIYVEVTAFAPDRQSWVVEALVLEGDTSDPDRGAFLRLTEVFETFWPDSFGGQRRVDAFGVDFGFRSHVVYAWVRGRPNTFALKGGDGWSRAPLSSPSLVDLNLRGKKIARGAAIWTVGTWSLKAQFYADLRKPRLMEGAEIEPGGACHHGHWLDENYFQQITAEYLTDERFRGRTRRIWKERGANHFLDCRVYNLALADYLGLSRMTSDEWAHLAKLRGVPGDLNRPDMLAPDVVKIAATHALRGKNLAQSETFARWSPSTLPSRQSRRSSFMD